MKEQKGNSSLTLDFKGIEVEVDFNYYKGESATHEFMGSGGTPGSPEDIEVIAVYYKDVDLYDLFVETDLVYVLEDEILNYDKY